MCLFFLSRLVFESVTGHAVVYNRRQFQCRCSSGCHSTEYLSTTTHTKLPWQHGCQSSSQTVTSEGQLLLACKGNSISDPSYK